MGTTAGAAVTSDTNTEIVRRYRAGESQAAIASSLGLGRGVIRRALGRLSILLRPKCPASGPHLQAILDRHAAGQSIQEISTASGLNFATVYNVLRRADRVRKKRR